MGDPNSDRVPIALVSNGQATGDLEVLADREASREDAPAADSSAEVSKTRAEAAVLLPSFEPSFGATLASVCMLVQELAQAHEHEMHRLRLATGLPPELPTEGVAQAREAACEEEHGEEIGKPASLQVSSLSVLASTMQNVTRGMETLLERQAEVEKKITSLMTKKKREQGAVPAAASGMSSKPSSAKRASGMFATSCDVSALQMNLTSPPSESPPEPMQSQSNKKAPATMSANSASLGRFKLQSDNLSDTSCEDRYSGRLSRPSFVAQQLGQFIRKKAPNRMKRVVTSSMFESLTGMLIVANAVFIGAETQWLSQSDQAGGFSVIAHLIFNLLFSIELVMRIAAYKRVFFCGKEYRWNWFDFTLVLTSIIDFFITVLNVNIASAGRSLRAIRLLRLTRTIRIVRTLKSVREFQKMVYALISSARTLLCSLMILFFVMYFFGIIFCQAATDYRLDQLPEIEDLIELYGGLGTTFYNLFLAACNGKSWHYVLLPLARIHWIYRLTFLFYMALVLFGVMNVVTSVFVESAIMSAQHYKDLIIQEKQQEKEIAMRHMKEVFSHIDEDNSGEITADEMEEFLMDPGLRKYVEALNISAEDTRMLFRLLDKDGSKKVDINEFCEGCLRLQGDAKSFDVHTMIFTIKQFLDKWSDFTIYVEERFENLAEFFVEVKTREEDADWEMMSNATTDRLANDDAPPPAPPPPVEPPKPAEGEASNGKGPGQPP